MLHSCTCALPRDLTMPLRSAVLGAVMRVNMEVGCTHDRGQASLAARPDHDRGQASLAATALAGRLNSVTYQFVFLRGSSAGLT
jgi:hypothetical protein